MTSLHDFLEKKRRARTRGKLAGLVETMLELKDLGASYSEIAEYILLEHQTKVSRSGVEKHLKSHARKQDKKPASAPRTAPPSDARVQPDAPTSVTELHRPTENANRSSETFTRPDPVESDSIQTAATSSAESFETSYRLGSPEHQEKLAAYRRQKRNPNT
ncbi:hypothetical protein QZM64_39580 [Burkholderia cepacia]|uniref:hypothetical protein n=1 Tax=Burkholderia cepacia TaxID=292 RepID=UPI002656408C|nr:hypothetical protein [Burkholderia cepacia]MDN7445273.1 hypothetical protein [Burkholderia cepacia]